jgi:hypothetical protein
MKEVSKNTLMKRLLVVPLVCALFAMPLWGADDHDHDHPAETLPRPGAGARPADSGAGESCTASPVALAAFANGERYDFNSVVSLISSPLCAVVHRQVSAAAISQGVNFNKSGPFRLDTYAKTLVSGPGGSVSLMDQTLARSIPQTLAENPLTSAELLPLLGQVSLLSPTAARSVLTTLIHQETQEADRKMSGVKASLAPAIAADLAVSLLRMGVLEPAIAADLGESVEDLALTVQADSLAKFFRGLAAAANAEPGLAATFNLSASALNRGVQKGKTGFNDDQQARLLRAVFEAVLASVSGSGALEPGAAELNEAMESLVEGQPLTLTALKKLWRVATQILSKSSTQSALAEALAGSLTPQVVFLRADVRESLLAAAVNYPVVARAIQQAFVDSWVKGWKKMSDGEMSVAAFNRLRVTYFEPFVPRLLDCPPDSIDPLFIRAVARWGILKESDIEKKLPRLFLAQLEKKDKASQAALKDESAEGSARALASSFSLLWSLHTAHLPVLNRWVKKNE